MGKQWNETNQLVEISSRGENYTNDWDYRQEGSKTDALLEVQSQPRFKMTETHNLLDENSCPQLFRNSMNPSADPLHKANFTPLDINKWNKGSGIQTRVVKQLQ